MTETILNIYLVIDKGTVTSFRVMDYKHDGDDDEKIAFLKSRAGSDFDEAVSYNAPIDKNGNFMKYRRFSKFESQGMHFRLFENIFSDFDLPENPLICVTPVVDGEVWAAKK